MIDSVLAGGRDFGFGNVEHGVITIEMFFFVSFDFWF